MDRQSTVKLASRREVRV